MYHILQKIHMLLCINIFCFLPFSSFIFLTVCGYCKFPYFGCLSLLVILTCLAFLVLPRLKMYSPNHFFFVRYFAVGTCGYLDNCAAILSLSPSFSQMLPPTRKPIGSTLPITNLSFILLMIFSNYFVSRYH